MKRKNLFIICGVLFISAGIIYFLTELSEDKVEKNEVIYSNANNTQLFDYPINEDNLSDLSLTIKEVSDLLTEFELRELMASIERADDGEEFAVFKIANLTDDVHDKIISNLTFPHLAKLIHGIQLRPTEELGANPEIIELVFAEIGDMMFDSLYDIIASSIDYIEEVVIVEIINVTDAEKEEILSKVSDPTLIKFIQRPEGAGFILDVLVE